MNTFVRSLKNVATKMTHLVQTPSRRFAVLSALFFCLPLMAPPAKSQPAISVAPDSLSAALVTGGVTSRQLMISNTGVGDLIFDISTKAVEAATVASVKVKTFGLNKSRRGLDTKSRSKSAEGAAGAYFDIPHNPSSRIMLTSAARTKAPKVLLLSNNGSEFDFTRFAKTALISTGLFTASDIDVLNDPAFISLADLMPYEAILAWTNFNFRDPQNIGDVLKQYVDAGGGSVIATYAYSIDWAIPGGILDANYSPFVPAPQQPVSGRLDMSKLPFPEHPVFRNIRTAPAYWWNDNYSNPSLNMGGVLLGIDTNGNNVVAENPNGRVVGIAVFPGILDVGNSRTNNEARQMFANALYYVRRIGWMRVDPISGTVPAGASVDIEVTFDASGLAGGDYDANIVIFNNDPDESKVIVPAHLKVTGAPDIALADTLLDFGTVFLSQIDTLQLTVSNNGAELLTISSISSDHSAFTPTLTNFSLNPGGSRNVPVVFAPNAVGAFSGSLTIASNDPDEATLTIALEGEGALPPEISVTPDSLSADLFTGETATRTLTISNTGNSDLSFEISIEGVTTSVTQTASLQTSQALALKPARKRALAGVLFAVDPNNASIVQLNPNTGEILNSIPVPSGVGGPDGLAYDGRYLYLKTGSSDTLYQIDKATGTVLARIFIEGFFGIDGLAHSGEALYALGYSSSTIYKIDFETATVVEQFTFDFGISGGITFGGRRGTLFVSDFGTAIYEIDPDNWQMINSFSPPNFGSVLGLGYSEGLGLLFASNTSDGMIYALDPNDGAVKFSFAFGFTSALASDEAIGVPWLSASPDTGTVAVGASADIAVVFDATGLEGGDYDAKIAIASNDPDEREIIVPAHLKVTGAPDIATNVDSVAFGVKFVGYGGTREVVVANYGTDTLKVSAIVSDHPTFSVTPTSLALAPRARANVKIIFLPTAAGEYDATLTMLSNDPDEAVVKIIMSGSAIEPPIAGIGPDSLSAALVVGDSTQRVMTITNTGGSDLSFKIGAVEVKSPERQAAKRIVSPEKAVRYTFSAMRELWRNRANAPSSHEETFEGGGAPVGARVPQAGNRSHRTSQNWQLLYTDPDEPDMTYDIRNVYGDVTQDEILFRLESYVSWTDPSGQGSAFIYVDADQDTSTGLNTESVEEPLGWFLGIDFAIFRLGNPSQDGFYRWDELMREFEKIGELTTNLVLPNSNETIVGIARNQLEESAAINFALFSGSGSDFQNDLVPDLGSGHITMLLSPSWLRFSEKEGAIPAGGQKQIDVTLDATGLIGGEYEAQTVIFTNDPAHPKLFMLVHLSVTGIPAIGLAADTVDFVTSYAGYKDSTYLRINNIGTDILTVESVVAGDGRVTVTPRSLAIRPFRSDSLKLYLLAASVGELLTTLSFTTNDPNRTSVTLPIRATVILAPNLVVSPTALHMQVEQGKTATDSLFINNNGGSDLDFSVRVSHQSKGQALSLDGSGDGMSVPDHAALDLQSSLTLEMWIYPTGIPQQYPRLLAKGWVSTSIGNFGVYELALFGEAGQDNAGPAFATIVDANTREPYSVFSGSVIEFNTWTHLAATYDGTLFRMYVNGRLEGENYLGAPIAVNNQILVIGKWYSGNFNSFMGEIDEVRVWNLARNAEEIRQLMFTSLAGNENGLVAYWRFDADFSDASPFKHQSTRLGNASLTPSSSPVVLEFLRLAPAFGKARVSEVFPLKVFANAAALSQGTYEATIHVLSNDPDEAERRVPVTVVVSPRVAADERLHSLPTEFALEQNYPNPFNPETEIRFALPQASHVVVKIFNTLGQEVHTLLNEQREAGFHRLRWDGKDKAGRVVVSGVYFYQLHARSFSQVKKMSLLR